MLNKNYTIITKQKYPALYSAIQETVAFSFRGNVLGQGGRIRFDHEVEADRIEAQSINAKEIIDELEREDRNQEAY
jgi:hypothetical protein